MQPEVLHCTGKPGICICWYEGFVPSRSWETSSWLQLGVASWVLHGYIQSWKGWQLCCISGEATSGAGTEDESLRRRGRD